MKPKKNVHLTGALGALLSSGEIASINTRHIENNDTDDASPINQEDAQYITKSGIKFKANDLISIDPKTCEPWKYAYRQKNDFGNMDELVESIKQNGQLQPGIIRQHPSPHGAVKYELIFGVRRHAACLQLNTPFLAILKDISNLQDAVLIQQEENSRRNNVSKYSEAILNKRLLDDGVFESEKALAMKLKKPVSTINDLMAYTKIPVEIIRKIPDINALSTNMAVNILALLKKDRKNQDALLLFAPEIGKSITSTNKLLKMMIEKNGSKSKSYKKNNIVKQYSSPNGKKLFTLKFDQRGIPCFALNKELPNHLNLEAICDDFKEYLQKKIRESGYPD